MKTVLSIFILLSVVNITNVFAEVAESNQSFSTVQKQTPGESICLIYMNSQAMKNDGSKVDTYNVYHMDKHIIDGAQTLALKGSSYRDPESLAKLIKKLSNEGCIEFKRVNNDETDLLGGPF